MNRPKNRTEEVWLEIDENIKKLTKILADINPEIYYDRTLNALYVSERAITRGKRNLIYASIKDPDMANCFLISECREPKIIRNRFELFKTLVELGCDANISNINGLNIIKAHSMDRVTHKPFFCNQHSYITITDIRNGSKTVDLEIHISNELHNLSSHKETREIDGATFDISTRLLVPNGYKTINMDMEESHKCTLLNIPITNLRDEIVKTKETVAKHSKLVAIDKLLRNEVK